MIHLAALSRLIYENICRFRESVLFNPKASPLKVIISTDNYEQLSYESAHIASADAFPADCSTQRRPTTSTS